MSYYTETGVLSTAKTYLSRLVECYADFLVPAAIFVVFNSCVDQHTRDPEKLSVLWLKFNQSSEATRASMFPVQQPGSQIAMDDEDVGMGAANMDDAEM